MSFTAFVRDNSAVLLLAGAALGWYIASLVAAEALAGGRLAVRRRTLGHWIPIAVMAVLAVLARQPEVALGALFGTSVAALSLVLGIVTVSHDFRTASTVPGGFPVTTTQAHPNFASAAVVEATIPARRLWAFVVPAALIALLAGFTGQLTLTHALVLLIEGLAILLVWRDQPDDALPLTYESSDSRAQRRSAEVVLAGAVAVVAALAGARATADVNKTLGLISGGFVTAVIVSPGLVLSMIGSGMTLARAGFYHSAVSMSVGVVLLNLCLGLPLVIGLWHARPVWQQPVEAIASLAPGPARATTPADAAGSTSPDQSASLRYPLPLWRVDTVILIVLGLMLLPLSVGRWLPGRFEGILMIFGYMIYMGLATFAARA